MSTRRLYLLLCVLGTVLPLTQFLPWLREQPLDAAIVARFVTELLSTRIGAFFGMDVIVSALVLFVFIGVEGRRLAMTMRWMPVVATLLVGVSLGLPLFLYQRQCLLDQRAARPVREPGFHA